jgi:hypothetical protein
MAYLCVLCGSVVNFEFLRLHQKLESVFDQDHTRKIGRTLMTRPGFIHFPTGAVAPHHNHPVLLSNIPSLN